MNYSHQRGASVTGIVDYDCTHRRVCQNRFSYYPACWSPPTQKIVGF